MSQTQQEFFTVLERMQGTRIDDQRCAMPAFFQVTTAPDLMDLKKLYIIYRFILLRDFEEINSIDILVNPF